MVTTSTENSHLRIKKLCKERGYTLKWLADQIGVKPEALNRSISSDSNPTLATLTNIASALNIPVQELFVVAEEEIKVSGHIEIDGTVYKIRHKDDLVKLFKKLKIE